MKKIILLIAIIILTACSATKKLKKERLKVIQTELNLTKRNLKAFKKKDSIVYELYTSIKDTVKIPLIKRRLDSFLLKNYNEKGLVSILQMDRIFKGTDLEFEQNRKANHLKDTLTKEETYKKLQQLAALYKKSKKGISINLRKNQVETGVVLYKTINEQDTIFYKGNIYPDYIVKEVYYPLNKIATTVIDRNNFKECNIKPYEFKGKCPEDKTKNYLLNYKDYKFDFKLKDKKEILGYNCFKIIARHKSRPDSQGIEMYVTNDFNIQYSFLINFESLDESYFVMMIEKNPLEGIHHTAIIDKIDLKYKKEKSETFFDFKTTTVKDTLN